LVTYTVRFATAADLRDARDRWNALVLKMPLPSFFCTWEWISTWLEVFGSQYEPVILFVYRGDELAGILPLCRREAVLTRGLMSGRILSYCGARELYPDHLDLIASEEDAVACLHAIWAFLVEEYSEWDVIHLSYLWGGSGLVSAILRPDGPRSIQTTQASFARYIHVSGTFDEFFDRFDKKFRYNVRSRRKKLMEEHGMRYITCDASRQPEALDLVFALNDRRFASKGVDSSLMAPSIIDFHRRLLSALDGTDRIELRLLGNDKQIAAASYNFRLDGRVFSYQKGIAPEWESYGPGTVLLYELVREAFESGQREYNFLQGGEDYKSRWAKDGRALFTTSIFNRTLKGVISNAGVRSKRLLKAALSRS
jgi:CelD/BcsL family acetyltransferase involved in cellulose biosynthesis